MIGSKEDPLGYGMDVNDASIGKRPTMNRQLSALQEVDESEEDETELLGNVQEEAAVEQEEEQEEDRAAPVVPIIPPETAPQVPESVVSPSGLRELRLSSSISSPRHYGTLSSSDIYSFPQSLTSPPPSAGYSSIGSSSPTKSYGTIGRGRPNQSIIDADTSNHRGPTPKRTALNMGSRGSLSCRKDASSSGGKELGELIASPTPTSTISGVNSPPIKGMWTNTNTRGMRPCPRVRLTGDAGSGRVLTEVNEMEEEGSLERRRSVSAGIDLARSSIESGRPSSEFSRDSLDRSHWRDVQLDMERENESLRDELGFWKERCRKLEERLESERKESVVLRERVRKCESLFLLFLIDFSKRWIPD